MDNSIYWLIAGAISLFLEAFGLPGFIFFFAGLSALCTGGLIASGVLEESEVLLQGAVFFGFTILWAVLLWKPLKKWRTTPSSGQEYSNIVGSNAVVIGEGFAMGEVGDVEWSGTHMKAKLIEGNDAVSAGDRVEIIAVEGTTLHVKTL
jgi:membrane protein implicated in regulation of membrane protease activity